MYNALHENLNFPSEVKIFKHLYLKGEEYHYLTLRKGNSEICFTILLFLLNNSKSIEILANRKKTERQDPDFAAVNLNDAQ